MTWDLMWDESFLEQIAEVSAKNNTNPVDWRVGGRSTKANPDKENKAWWDENGKRMFFDFINAWQESGFEVWVSPEGVPGIEIGFNNNFGAVPVKAFADAVVMAGNEVAVVDFKTGSYIPDSSLQLGVYASLMEMQFGFRPTKGYYYDARKAQFIEASGLERWTIPVLTELFTKFDIGIRNEIFLPNIGMSCSTCGVKEYCYAVGGQLAQIYDPLANIKEKESK
jgi:putative RecB family exonuclease